MFFRVENTYYNLSTVAEISWDDHNEILSIKHLNLEHANFERVRIIFLKEYKIPQLTFFTEDFSVQQIMYDFQNHRRKVYEFCVLEIEDMKKINQKAKEQEEAEYNG